MTVLRTALRLARLIGTTAPLSSSLTTEVSPGSSVQTDDEWNQWIENTVGTEFHPSGTCAMLPVEQGGVVGSDLRVYGTCECPPSPSLPFIQKKKGPKVDWLIAPHQ